MIEIGTYSTLNILKETSVGLRLGDRDGADVLLPNKYVPEEYEIGDEIEVFCYLDNEERPVATSLRPHIVRDDFAFLRVAEVNQIGAFLDWGLEKHLLVPFKEQSTRMIAGQWYVVYCYLDPKSSRLVASSRLDRFLDNSEIDLKRGEEVELLVTRKTELGWELVVNNRFKGLAYADEIYSDLASGDKRLGYVKKIREDHKLDISLQPLGHEKLEPSASKIYNLLRERGGVLKLHDRSDPDEVREQLQMSKKTFKKAIGVLYRERKILIKDDGIYQIGKPV